MNPPIEQQYASLECPDCKEYFIGRENVNSIEESGLCVKCVEEREDREAED